MKFFCTLTLSTLFSIAVFSQDQAWIPVNEASINKNLFANSKRPDQFRLFQLNVNAFRESLLTVPGEKQVQLPSAIISFPAADGRIVNYRVVEAPVMAPELSARYPGVQSFAGKGIEDSASTIRFDFSPAGLHATVLSAGQPATYIDPLVDNYYRVVKRSDVGDYHRQFRCLTEGNEAENHASAARPTDADDGKLRAYRLAMASAGEFSQHWLNGTEPDDAARITKVLIAQNSQLTRANAVFERDFAVRLILVANNDALIFLDPATDPVANPNTPSGAAVQSTIDAVIGAANYDIGHLESKGDDNGNAGCIGCVCTDGLKGRGWTVYSDPSLLDFFVIDYLTHEMGHQLGANHTFTFQNEGNWVQVEPGSGSTIMGYAGITGSTDVQPHSDDYFHAASIEQVTGYIKSSDGSCAVATVTGNTAPTANAGADYIIPRSTPFKLTGVASDPNAGDVLSFTWEQMDAMGPGSSTFPSINSTAGPQFRSIAPALLPERVFPKLSSILSGANGNQWEKLPAVERAMNFRFTARDNHPGAGGNRSDDMIVSVTALAGPFAVTSPGATVTWFAGTTQAVTWSVNGTTAAPVSCSQVKISLSTDGGLTFPIVLAPGTPNDGTEDIIVPGNISTTCRVKVEAIGNIFFDINDADFTIAVPPPGFEFGGANQASFICGTANSPAIAVGTVVFNGFNTPIQLSASATPPGTSVSFSTNPVAPGGFVNVILTNTASLSFGTYTITISGTGGSVVKTRDLKFVVQPGAGPLLSEQPNSQIVCANSNVTFSSAANGSVAYQWEQSTDGGSVYSTIAGANSSTYTINNVSTAMSGYRYRVIVTGQCNFTVSDAATLTVNERPAVVLTAAPYTQLLPGQSTVLNATINPAVTGFNFNWYLNGQQIPGAAGQSYLVDSAAVGDYRVDIINPSTGCTNQSSVLRISATPGERLFIFPSPNNGQFTVSYYNAPGTASKRSVLVFDAHGAKKYEAGFVINGPYQLLNINIRPAAPGIYLVVVGDEAGKKLAAGKVLVN